MIPSEALLNLNGNMQDIFTLGPPETVLHVFEPMMRNKLTKLMFLSTILMNRYQLSSLDLLELVSKDDTYRTTMNRTFWNIRNMALNECQL